jgi:hypothetical protein
MCNVFDAMLYHSPCLLMTAAKKTFRPGEPVPETAVYTVIHAGHRATHEVTLRRGEVFPPCARCSDKVQFEFSEETSSRKPRVRRRSAGK